jgi:ribonuclease Z
VIGNPQSTFVLIHFSLRHSDREVVEFFQRELDEPEARASGRLANIVVWASASSLLPEQHQRR